MSSSTTQHPFEALSTLEDDFNCPVCIEPMLPCLTFGCHQICGPCADSLPNKRKCPTCNKVWKDLPTRNALISGMIEKAVAGQVFRCCLCQEILTGPVERDAHPPVCAAVEQPQQQPQQQQQQPQQLAPPPEQPAPPPPPPPAPELPLAPSKPASGAAPAAAAAASSVFTKQCSDCKESLPRGSFIKSQWSRKDGAFRCTNCVNKDQQTDEQQRRCAQEEQRRRKEEEQRCRKEEEQRRREQEEQRRREEQCCAALLDAASQGNVDAIRSLIAHPDFTHFRDLRNKDGQTALHVASQKGHTKCVGALLEAGCDATLVDSAGGDTALHWAAVEGHVDVVRMLVTAPGFAKVCDRRCKEGNTALLPASWEGYAECVRALLEGGCNIALANHNGFTALHYAVVKDSVGIIRMLVAHADFAKIRDLCNKNGHTPLHFASLLGHAECARALLEAGCNIALANHNGFTALHHAVLEDRVGIIRMLVAHADFAKIRDLRNKEGETPLHLASGSGHAESAQALLEAGCNIALANHNGFTALHHAVLEDSVGIIRMLVAHADFAKVRDLCNKNGQTASDVAVTVEMKRILQS